MDKDSVLYQLMDLRVNTIMNSIVGADEDYQDILRRSDEYSGRLETMGLPKETMQLIDRYVSEQNALGARYGALAYLLGFSAFRTALNCSAAALTSMPMQKPY